jgi:pyrroline-5-carboxylate reductase
LLELAEGNEAARQFTGNVFNAAASLSRDSLQRVFPRATIFCISPFLIDGVNSIPMLVLRPDNLPAPKWAKAKAELEVFGDCDVVDDEETFAQLSLLGASWPAVVLAGVQAAASAGVQHLPDEAATRLGRRIFFRAIQNLLATRAANLEDESANEIATPGGITERGFKSLGDVTSLFESVFKQMQARAGELRA